MFPRCKISSGFCLLVLWFAYANGWRLLGMVLTAALVHELGHCLALYLLGGQITAFRVGILGAVLETKTERLSYGKELAVVLSGPGANLLAAAVLSRMGAMSGCGAHLVLAAFNLLPLWPLDGGRALELMVSWAVGPEAGFQAVRCVGAAAALLAGGALAYLVWVTGGSLWLLSAAGGLLAAGGRSFLGKMRN